MYSAVSYSRLCGQGRIMRRDELVGYCGEDVVKAVIKARNV
jgi:hypothetical protein